MQDDTDMYDNHIIQVAFLLWTLPRLTSWVCTLQRVSDCGSTSGTVAAMETITVSIISTTTISKS